MKKLMNIIVLSCRKATFLVEKGHTDPLSLLDKMQLNMHLKICDKCSTYRKQSMFIEQEIKNNRPEFSVSPEIKLSDMSKSRMQKAIEQNLNK